MQLKVFVYQFVKLEKETEKERESSLVTLRTCLIIHLIQGAVVLYSFCFLEILIKLLCKLINEESF